MYKEDYTPSFYLHNLKKKTHTLLIPYILWNLICLGIYFLKVKLSGRVGLEVYDEELAMLATPLWRHLIEPVNFPLWYVRDLIGMNLILPFFYYLFKYTRRWGILLLYLGYLLGSELPISGFGSTAILYVGAGVYCGRNKVYILELCRRYHWAITLTLTALLLLALFNNQHPKVEYLIRLYIPLGIALVLNATAWVYRLSQAKRPYRLPHLWIKLCRYCLPASFFVYVTHTLVINKMMNRILSTLGNTSGYWQLFAYFAGVGLTIAVCIMGYKFINKLSPKLMVVLTGGRS